MMHQEKGEGRGILGEREKYTVIGIAKNVHESFTIHPPTPLQKNSASVSAQELIPVMFLLCLKWTESVGS